MKIKAITFRNHPILGDLHLDFCNSKGDPIDTIILAGANGTGKTTVINTLFHFMNVDHLPANSKNGLLYPGTSIDIQIPFDLLKAILGAFYSPDIEYSDTMRLSIVDSGSSADTWLNIKISYFDISGQELQWKGHPSSLIMTPIPSCFSALYNDVQINFSPRPIQHTTALELDHEYNIKRSSENMATELAQLFVDIQSSDAQDLSNWVADHPGEVPPEDIQRIRIKRFDRAFSTIFKDFHFYRVINRDGKLDVCFRYHDAIVPIDKLSSGEKQIVFRGGFILKDSHLDKTPITFIDEPEISLHPDWQIKILNYYKQLLTNDLGKQVSQLFVVTHSPFIIHNDLRANDKVIVLYRDKHGHINVQDKPEYYESGSISAVKDAFLIDLSQMTSSSPFVFLEGETDETYMRKAVELFGIATPASLNWIGSYINNSPQNTGDTALSQAFKFLIANPSVCPQGAVLLYDSDTKQVVRDVENIHTRIMPSKESAVGFKAGIDNMLALPPDFDLSPFIKTSVHKDRYGMESEKRELDKVGLCEYICSQLSEAEQKNILGPLKENISIIESALK